MKIFTPFSSFLESFRRHAARSAASKLSARSAAPNSKLHERKGRLAAFTLIELLAVVGVIALLSVLAVGGYTGIMRAMSESAASDGLRRAVMLARQQACVDGEDLWVWPTGEDRFIILRKIGTVVDTDSGSRKPSYFRNGNASSRWIIDPYADMEDASSSFSGVDGLDDATYDKVAEDFVKKFSAQYVFDLTSQTLAVYQYPPWYDTASRAWIFGIKAVSGSLGNDDFAIGDDYGVVVQPEQYLSKGYLFEGSVDGDGEFNPRWAKQNAVHVKADGTIEREITYVISDGSEREDSKKTKVIVKRDGSVRVES